MPSRIPRTLLAALATTALLCSGPVLAGPAAAAPAAVGWDTDRAATAYAVNPAAVTGSGSENAGTAPGLAFDGDGATRWSSDFADDAWIRVDLGSVIRVDRVVLDWEAAYGKRYVLEASRNGTDWTPFYTETAGTGGSVTAHTYPQEVTGRYVRLRGLERATPYGYSLWNFKVYGGEPAPASTTRTNLALNHPAYSNYYQHAGNSPAFVTDGGWPANLKDDATRWSSDWNADRWVSVDLGAPSVVSSVDLYWEAAYAVDYPRCRQSAGRGRTGNGGGRTGGRRCCSGADGRPCVFRHRVRTVLQDTARTGTAITWSDLRQRTGGELPDLHSDDLRKLLMMVDHDTPANEPPLSTLVAGADLSPHGLYFRIRARRGRKRVPDASLAMHWRMDVFRLHQLWRHR
ncbi:Secreted protein [Streptomyces hygroscopicus subsp. limoneus]|nr:Secreted protein [Streptomyces hygroscopicus subsp. limoneus]